VETRPKTKRLVEFITQSILFAFEFTAMFATTGFPVVGCKIHRHPS
jgi:hypothetical protein